MLIRNNLHAMRNTHRISPFPRHGLQESRLKGGGLNIAPVA
jgi:hypothetical protein